MDILTDILNTAGLKKRILNNHSVSKAWSFTFPCPKSFGFHVVTQGKGYLWQANKKEPILLNKGDIAFMTRGMIHHITTHPDITLINKKEENKFISESEKSNKPILTLVSGAYQLWNEPIHHLFIDLPDWEIIKGESISYSDSIQNCLKMLSAELEEENLGSESIISSLLDIMFNLILRKIFETSSKNTIGNAIKDPIINKALQLMHSKPYEDWTVEQLADKVGLSRSGFSLKFKQYLGNPPLTYLTTLRIFKATDLLNNTDYTLEKISSLVGYKDAFSFSKTFKRITGISPKTFRDKLELERNLKERFS